MFIYIAIFEYGEASLIRATLIKETELTYITERHSEKLVVGKQRYLPNRLAKSSYKVFMTVDDGLHYLMGVNADYIKGLKIKTLKAQVQLIQIAKVSK